MNPETIWAQIDAMKRIQRAVRRQWYSPKGAFSVDSLTESIITRRPGLLDSMKREWIRKEVAGELQRLSNVIPRRRRARVATDGAQSPAMRSQSRQDGEHGPRRNEGTGPAA